MLRRSWVLPVVFALGASVVSGCANEPPKTALGYTENAKRAYDAAMAQYEAHSWIDAQAMMREVKRKYSYSKYARLAELRIADADYEQEKYPEAIHEYKDFIHAHRSEEEDVAYARSRIAEATYAEIPESFLMPASEERDQGAVVDAYKEIKSYLNDYPSSKQTARMSDLLAQVTARLIRHELYVARFYLQRDNHEAAVARIQYALHTYAVPTGRGPNEASSLAAESQLLLGQTYLQMQKWADARQAFEAVLVSDSQSPVAVQARNYLEYMKRRGV